MDPEEAAKRDGKARRIFNVTQHSSYLDQNYAIAVLDGSEITCTGRLAVARLRPENHRKGKFPEFVFRWDEKANALDVDAENVSRTQKKQFEKGQGDFGGHHTIKVGSDPRVFEADIIWGGQRIYHGNIGFSLHREFKASATLGLSASATVKVDKEDN